MNINQAKQIPLADILSLLGHEPQRQANGQLWYLSPFRQEKTPSFKVNPTRNQWYDFGDGRYGDIIDLVREIGSCHSTSETLSEIARLVGGSGRPPPPRPPAPAMDEPGIQLVSMGPVTSPSLHYYLRQRGIDVKLTAPYLQEARYRLPGRDREYYALAFANDSGGYELRNPYQKLTLGRKDLSTLADTSDKVIVFEGFMDFLTAVTMFSDSPDGTVLVLNSVALKEWALEKVQQMQPKTVELYRDHDAAGESLLESFRNGLPDTKIIDRAELYEGHEDLNAWHTGSHSTKSAAAR